VSRVAPKAPTGELLPAPISDGKGQSSLTLHRYGVGVDCHSRFFQVCLLIPDGTLIVKLECRVPALWPELRAAQAWVLRELLERGIAVSPTDLRYTCESTGQYHMPLCLAWKKQTWSLRCHSVSILDCRRTRRLAHAQPGSPVGE
jgi:hypothetical protein